MIFVRFLSEVIRIACVLNHVFSLCNICTFQHRKTISLVLYLCTCVLCRDEETCHNFSDCGIDGVQ